jgi:HK97 family phage prohead protease
MTLSLPCEIRAGVELRADGRRLVGHASIFNTQADIGGAFREIVRPGAFRATLASGRDVVGLLDHNPVMLLGRTASGTLRLSEDSRGLAFELDTPDTQLGRDTLVMAQRGDLRGASFSFRATNETWPTRDLRELRSVELHDISLVSSFPAYSGTDIAIRSRDAVFREIRIVTPMTPDQRRRVMALF